MTHSEFRPAKAARDGLELKDDGIPDGFYLVGDTESPQASVRSLGTRHRHVTDAHDDTESPQPEWHAAIIDSVRAVTHIAPADASGKIIGEAVTQEGVVAVPSRSLFLCARPAIHCRTPTIITHISS